MPVKQNLIRTSLRVTFWNVRSVRQHIFDIENLLKECDILICVESWLRPDTVINFPGFVAFRKDRDHTSGGGILLLIRKDLAFVEISNVVIPDQSVEMCGIKLNSISPPLDVLVCYRTPGLNLSQNDWNLIINNTINRKNCLLLGDFNAHNQSWNCRYTDVNGERLKNSSDTCDLFLHNFDTNTRIDSHRMLKSNIDLIFSSTNIADKINVKVLNETWGSDHYPIKVAFDSEKHVYVKKSLKIKMKRTNWTMVNKQMDKIYPEFLTAEYEFLDAIEKYEKFVKSVTEALRKSTPEHKNKNKNKQKKIHNPVSWWDSDCDRVKRLRTAAKKKVDFSNLPEDWIKYKEACAIARRTFKQKKIDNFKVFAASLDFRSNPTFVWNKCRIFKSKWVKITPSHYTENLQENENIEIAVDKICPSWAPTNPDVFPVSQSNDHFEAQFTFLEFNVALEDKNKNSAPGLDGIDFEVIDSMATKFKLLLLDIFNHMYSSSAFPRDWKN